MRALALLLGIIGVSAAATIYAMDGRDVQEAMMKEMLAREGHNPVPPAMGTAMGFGALMGQHGEQEGPGFEALGDEVEEGVADREARNAEELGSVGREGKSPAEGNGQGASGFGTMMGMMFPEMMFGGGAYDAAPAPYAGNGYHGNNGHAQANGNGRPIPSNGNGHPLPSNGNVNGYSRPANGNGHAKPANGNGHAIPANGNGNGHAIPANGNGNGHAKPTNGNGNGHSRPANGNGNRGGYGGAAAATANSFSRGSNSFASSQAQAFSGNFGNGNH